MNEQSISPTSPLRLSGHIPALDALRGLAILMVMTYHFGDFNSGMADNAEPPNLGALKVLRQGSFGVDLFFVLSGFLITDILFGAKHSARYFRNFYIRRTLRIFPLYYAVLFGTFILLPLVTFGAVEPYPDSAANQGWLWLYGTNIIQSMQEKYLLTGFNHFWSLAVEEHFYLVWPLVIFLCSRRAGIVVSVLCILGAVALRLALALTGDPQNNFHSVAIYTLTPCRMDALALGSLLALLARGPLGIWGIRTWVLAGGMLSGVLLAVVYVFGKHYVPNAEVGTALRHTLWPGFFAGVLVWSITVDPDSWAGRFWNSRTLQFFGKYSYGLYVFHYLLLPVFQQFYPTAALARATGSPIFARLLFIIAATGVTVVVALLSWHLFEKHFLKLKDVWAPSRSAKSAPVPDGMAVKMVEA